MHLKTDRILIATILVISAVSVSIWCWLPLKIQNIVDLGINYYQGEGNDAFVWTLWKAASVIILLIVSVFFCDIWRYWCGARLGRNIGDQLRTNLVNQFLEIPITHKAEPSDAVQRIIVDGEQVNCWWSSIWPNLIFNSILLVGATAGLCVYSPPLAVTAFFLFLLGGWFQKWQSKYLKEKMEAQHEQSRFLQHDVHSLVLGRPSWLREDEDYIRKRMISTVSAVSTIKEMIGRLSSVCYEASMVGRLMIQCTLLLSALVLVNKNLTLGKLVALSEYFGMISGAAAAVWSSFPDWRAFLSAKQRLKSKLVLSEFPNPDKNLELLELEISKGPGLIHLKGANGSGKTSILHHLVEKQRRKIRIVFVAQSPILFESGVEENVALSARFNPSQILKMKLFDFEKSYNNLIEQINDRKNAQVWSGGQRQFISILRGFLREGDLYIFDEPLTHLDADLKQIVLEAIRKLSITKTVLIVEHVEKSPHLIWERKNNYEMDFLDSASGVRPSPLEWTARGSTDQHSAVLAKTAG